MWVVKNHIPEWSNTIGGRHQIRIVHENITLRWTQHANLSEVNHHWEKCKLRSYFPPIGYFVLAVQYIYKKDDEMLSARTFNMTKAGVPSNSKDTHILFWTRHSFFYSEKPEVRTAISSETKQEPEGSNKLLRGTTSLQSLQHRKATN